MRWLWAAVLLSALVWLNTVKIFTALQSGWVWLIVLAILAAGAGLRKASVRQFSGFWLLALIPLGLAIRAVPFPFSLPPVLVCVALILLATVRLSPALAWVGLPVGLVGLVLSVQMAVLPVLYVLSSRVHEISWLAPSLYGLIRIFEPQVSLSQGHIIIHQVNDNFEFLARSESLGLIPGVLFAIGGLVVLVAHKKSVQNMLGFLALIVGYSVLRYILLVFLTVKVGTAGVFWLPVPVALSYVPLVIILAAVPWFGAGPREVSAGLRRPRGRRTFPAFALAALAVFGLIGFFAYHDAGSRKQGRILIDELHSDWEWTTLKYDTQWYGRKSGYNYYCLAEYLNLHYRVEASSDSLLPELLSGYDVVMLKTPTSPYSEREIAALEEYVRQGGGLWLIGDHTNVFGTGTYLNQVAERFGLRFRYDSTYDLMTMALSVYRRPAIFAHPTVAFLPPFLFATSCTIESPFQSENMILGSGLKAMELDYGQASFFPKKTDQNYGYGVFVQQGGVKYGKGRVAGFTDSTCFSNFFMFIPGKPELVLATVEWLNRMNRFAWVNVVLLICGLLSAIGACVLLRGLQPEQQAVLAIAAGCLGLAIAVAAYDGHVRRSYRLPEPHTDFTHVAFESEHSAFTLPTRGLTKNPEISLHTFYVWTQRLGFFPSYEQTLEDALAKGDIVVVANPAVPFDASEIDAVKAYLNAGGKLLILIDPLNREDAQVRLLESLGVELDRREEDVARPVEVGQGVPGPEGEPRDSIGAEGIGPDIQALDILDLEGKVLVRAGRPTGLSGGTPRLYLSDGRAALVEVKVGKGRVFVFSDFFLFTVASMGHTGVPVDDRRRGISELEYWMLRGLLANE